MTSTLEKLENRENFINQQLESLVCTRMPNMCGYYELNYSLAIVVIINARIVILT